MILNYVQTNLRQIPGFMNKFAAKFLKIETALSLNNPPIPVLDGFLLPAESHFSLLSY